MHLPGCGSSASTRWCLDAGQRRSPKPRTFRNTVQVRCPGNNVQSQFAAIAKAREPRKFRCLLWARRSCQVAACWPKVYRKASLQTCRASWPTYASRKYGGCLHGYLAILKEAPKPARRTATVIVGELAVPFCGQALYLHMFLGLCYGRVKEPLAVCVSLPFLPCKQLPPQVPLQEVRGASCSCRLPGSFLFVTRVLIEIVLVPY